MHNNCEHCLDLAIIIISCPCLSFQDSAWLDELVIGGGGRWELRIKGDLTVRSDTGSINNSPVTSMNPILKLQSNCDYEIQIPGM